MAGKIPKNLPLSQFAKKGLGMKPKRPAKPLGQWTIMKGDLVEVLRGVDAGKQGVVTEVVKDRNSVVVEGARMVRRFRTANPVTRFPGGYVNKEAIINVLDVALVDPESKLPTTVVLVKGQDGKTVRLGSETGVLIPWIRAKPEENYTDIVGPKDTVEEVAHRKTYVPSMLSFEETIRKSLEGRADRAMP